MVGCKMPNMHFVLSEKATEDWIHVWPNQSRLVIRYVLNSQDSTTHKRIPKSSNHIHSIRSGGSQTTDSTIQNTSEHQQRTNNQIRSLRRIIIIISFTKIE